VRRHLLYASACTALLAVWLATPTRAGDLESWPEVSVFARLNAAMRLHLLATTVESGGETTEGEFGADLDLHLKPIGTPKHFGGFRVDESKNRVLQVRAGYHYLRSYVGKADEDRWLIEVTTRYPLLEGVLVSWRNRMDFRFIGGDYSWRYRSRLSTEKEFDLWRVRMDPYGRVEAFYSSSTQDWSRTEWTVGSAFPLGKHLELEGYWARQDNYGASNRQPVSAIAGVINVYF
jgi:hypothetical protein